jgi:hypothetical protein
LTIGGTDIFQDYMKNQCSEKPGYKGVAPWWGQGAKPFGRLRAAAIAQEVDVCVNLYWVLPDAVFGQKFENA